jgi:glucose/arabinose dehydrogenase
MEQISILADELPLQEIRTRAVASILAAALAAAIGTAAISAAAMADSASEPVRPPPPPPQPAKVVKTGYQVIEIAKGLDHPWSMAFLPDGSMLVTERVGGSLLPQPIAGVPTVHTGSQAGLFDIVLHPNFAQNNIVYLTYAAGTKAANGTQVARARFDGSTLQDLKVIFTAMPLKDTDNHYGGRMAFLPDGTFALTIGEGFEYREKAQDLSSDLGKIVRLNEDGSVPRDNPFIGRPSVRPEIYTWGHRNAQGLIYDAQSARLYETEHGPRGGDELNIIVASRNYGWPVITYGMDYSGAYVSPYTQRPGLEQPVIYWTPSIAPSGLAMYRGDKFPAWQGDLFVGALAFRHLRRVHLDERGNVVDQEQLLNDLHWRIRDVRAAPDGYLYVCTDESDGRVLRLEPANSGNGSQGD